MDALIAGLVTLAVVVPFLAFWLWMFREMTTDPTLTRPARVNWTFIFVVLNVFGALLYYLYQYRRKL